MFGDPIPVQTGRPKPPVKLPVQAEEDSQPSGKWVRDLVLTPDEISASFVWGPLRYAFQTDQGQIKFMIQKDKRFYCSHLTVSQARDLSRHFAEFADLAERKQDPTVA